MLCFPKIGDYGYLGNAMFQYASLLGIANKHGVKAKYDFEKVGNMVTLHDVFDLKKAEHMDITDQIHSVRGIWKEPHFHFSPEAFPAEEGSEDENSLTRLKDNRGLYGYFQSEKYFKHIESDIRSEFKFSDEVEEECSSKIKEVKEMTDGNTLVSVHVRLGDYTKLEHVFYPLIKTSYYQDALNTLGISGEQIIGEKNDTTLVVFSNDIEMSKQLFPSPKVIFVEGGSAEQDMCLMSKCDNHIIANSSFSWWGAWLNENKNKKVIAPNHWFINDSRIQYTNDANARPEEARTPEDLYCDGWITI